MVFDHEAQQPVLGGGSGQARTDTTDRKYLIAISQAAQIGPARLKRLRDRFSDLATVWEADPRELSRVLDERALNSLLATRSMCNPDLVLEAADRLGISLCTIDDQDYPVLLSHIAAAPPVIYYKGTLPLQTDLTVAIVGTRRATSYGREITLQIASELAAAGVTVVSGLARGIDGFAHRGALEGGGRTIAVMANGVDIIYPAEHRPLAESIIEHGALISDYPPGTKPEGPNFPARNRLISGLSLATLVVEAPARSGALITVNFAADQGRDVFVVPGNVLSAASQGVNRLLRDGARAITSAADLLEDLGVAVQVNPPPVREALPLTPEESRLYALVTSEAQHIDELAYAANLTISEASALMTMLELKGLVQNSGAQHFIILTRSKRPT
jgi:DNA processing protein